MINKKAPALLFVLYAVLAIGVLAFLSPEALTPKVSTAATETLGVYWDKSCSQQVYSIDWGSLSRGGFKRHTVYARNDGGEQVIFVVIPRGWNPENAYLFLTFAWDYSGAKVAVGQVMRITLDLRVSAYVGGIDTFNFDVLFKGLTHFLGDIDRNGAADMHDVGTVARKYMLRVADPGYDPTLDLNMDDVINIHDVSLVAADFGKIWT